MTPAVRHRLELCHNGRMTNTILFVTGNKGKVAFMQHYLDDAGIDIAVETATLDIKEVQADTALEVAREKALEAFRILKKPLVVDDSEFRITALNGFPGPYQKYMVHTIGAEGLVRLMDGYDDRRAYFVSNLVFVDADGSLHEFSDDPFNVTVVEQYDESVPDYAWGPLGKVCVMEGTDKVLSLLAPGERAAIEKKRGTVDAYQRFCAWYKEHHA